LRDSAESDLLESAAFEEPKEPKPPDFFAALLLDLDADDEEDDERCDENPLLKDEEELDGLASAGTLAASGRISDSASRNATCAYFEKGFSMVRSAVES
jgi:hypothetical protein